jgi:hypothetical protein
VIRKVSFIRIGHVPRLRLLVSLSNESVVLNRCSLHYVNLTDVRNEIRLEKLKTHNLSFIIVLGKIRSTVHLA